MNDRLLNFIQSNSPDGGFLQSEYWRNFQEKNGWSAFELEEKDENGDTLIYAYVIVHKLPVVGDYFYIPRGPVMKISNFQFPISNKIPNPNEKISKFIKDFIILAKKNNIGWIRVEPNSENELGLVKENLLGGLKMKKAQVNIQPREILILDISKSGEEILAEMKQKTRYNIRLAEKKGVAVFSSHERKYVEEFLRLVKITSKRDKITAHPENYYRKMFETIPRDILKLFIAEYNGKVIAANLVSFFGKTATYMHGASDDIHRDVMAPYLLQWRQILEAKKAGCEKYDFGGVKIEDTSGKSWAGVTKFKTGFVPELKPIEFPGCYDIVLKPGKYRLYKILQKIKRIFE